MALLIMGNTIWEKLRFGKSTGNDVKGGDKISRILQYLRKFAVDESLKGVAGGVIVDKIAKEGLKDEAPLEPSMNQKNNLSLELAEEIRAGIEKMQEFADCVEPQVTMSTQNMHMLDCFEEFPKQPIKGSNSSKAAPRRIMIRSRL